LANRRQKKDGSVYFNKQRKKWIAQLTLPNGRKRSKSDTNRSAAVSWLIDQQNQINRGIYVEDTDVRLGDFIERYMEDVGAATLRPASIVAYNNYINNHIIPELGNYKLTDLRPEHVQQFYANRLRNGLSKRGVEHIHAILHKVLKQAMRWGLVTRNVTELVDVPRPKRKPPTIWTAEQVRTFLNEVEGHRWYAIYVVAVFTGMRVGEILGLYISDVDIEKSVINIRHQLQYLPGQGLVISQPKSEKAKRPVLLPPTARQVLAEHLDQVKDNQQLVFVVSTGNAVSPRNLTRHFKNTIREIGLPDIRFHDLRHFHASSLLAAGTHPKVVQERLGHSQISLTLDTYSSVIPSLQEEAVEQFESILDI
jgi:integrase